MNSDIVGKYYDFMVNNCYLSKDMWDFSGTSYQVNDKYGKGMMRRFVLGNGLDISFWSGCSAVNLQFKNLPMDQEVFEICYCLEGQMRVNVCDINGEYDKYDMAQEDMLFYYHKNTLSTFQLSAKRYSGFSIHIHKDYLRQLLVPACGEMLSKQWGENMGEIFRSKGIFVQRAPLQLQVLAKKMKPVVWNDMKTYLAFQSKIMEFLSWCMHYDCKREASCSLTQEDLASVKKARQYLLDHLIKPPLIKELARYCNTNSTKLQKDFKCVHHATVYSYIKRIRLEKSQLLLKNTNDSIISIANQIGYVNPSKFSSAFKTYTGMSPSEYKKTSKDKRE